MKRRKHCAEIRAGREAQVRDNMSVLCSKEEKVSTYQGGTPGTWRRK